MGLFDKMLDMAGKANDKIYYGRYDKDHSVKGTWGETVSSGVMSAIAKAGGDDESAKYHAKQATKAGAIATAKELLK